jgi:hypothetical protein
MKFAEGIMERIFSDSDISLDHVLSLRYLMMSAFCSDTAPLVLDVASGNL